MEAGIRSAQLALAGCHTLWVARSSRVTPPFDPLGNYLYLFIAPSVRLGSQVRITYMLGPAV
jgi:hypothetical protein